jgi:hypothetical protein
MRSVGGRGLLVILLGIASGCDVYVKQGFSAKDQGAPLDFTQINPELTDDNGQTAGLSVNNNAQTRTLEMSGMALGKSYRLKLNQKGSLRVDMSCGDSPLLESNEDGSFTVLASALLGLGPQAASCQSAGQPFTLRTTGFSYSRNMVSLGIKPLRDLSSAAGMFSATLTSGDVLLTGGYHYDDVNFRFIFFKSAALFHSKTLTFEKVGDLGAERFGAGMVPLADGRALVVGSGGFGNADMWRSVEMFEPAKKTFRRIPGTILGDIDFQSAQGLQLSSGQVLLVANHIDVNKLATSAALFDPKTEKFSATGNPLSPKVGQLIELPAGKVLMAGGGREGLETYDPNTGKFGDLLPDPLMMNSAVQLTDGRILLAGTNDETIRAAEIYDPMNNTLRPTAGMLTVSRVNPVLTRMPDGKVLVASAIMNQFDRPEDDCVEIFDPATETFSMLPGVCLPVDTYGITAHLLPTGQVFIPLIGVLDDLPYFQILF